MVDGADHKINAAVRYPRPPHASASLHLLASSDQGLGALGGGGGGSSPCGTAGRFFSCRCSSEMSRVSVELRTELGFTRTGSSARAAETVRAMETAKLHRSGVWVIEIAFLRIGLSL